MSIFTFLFTHGAELAQALLALVGALASLFHVFHADGANGFFDKVTGALTYVATFFSKTKE